MIRKYLPAFVLSLLAAVCALTAVGALAAATAVWLSTYWGMGWALVAVAFLFVLLSALAWLSARLWMDIAGRRHDPVSDLVEGVWKMNPGAIAVVAALALLLFAAKPGFIGRVIGAAARSTGALMLLRKIL